MTIAPDRSTASGADVAAHLAAAMSGEVDASPRRRAEYATDASNYRVMPAVVAYPRDADDLEAGLAAAREAGVPVTMRGGGTSVAGNSIGTGVVFDTTRHMNRVLEVDVEARTARVQPGVVMSDLQKLVAPHGLRFGPDPSTQNRATFGGMIGNNACGPHAVAYGKTAQNVVSLDVVDGRGRRFTAGPKGLASVPGLEELVMANLALIRTEFGRFERQVSGYSLEHLLPELGADLARFLVGTEGTLATTLEATVLLREVAPARLTGVFAYADMPAAADAVVPMLAHRPHAVEGLDARLVNRVRASLGAEAVPPLPDGAGWLFVEVGADTPDEAEEIMAALAADSGTASYAVVRDAREAARLWAIRADGAGLAGRTVDGRECWPGWEDAAVPPEKLGAYLRAFDALMAEHGIEGQPFGHFGDGCIHVRLDIPLATQGGPALRSFMEGAADLIARYGGSLSGEHGDGRARSELLDRMYSPEALALFKGVKHLFDPDNLLNPGVVVDPAPLDADLRRPSAPRSPSIGHALLHDHGDLTEAVHRCTGVGKCRANAIGSGSGFMCPSYQATGDEKDVTRGRARVLQEALQHGGAFGLDSPEVRESLDLCLSCKACSSDCPSGVDMAAYKSEVLHRTYKGRLRPMGHYSIGWLPRWMKVIGRVPWLVNGVLGVGWIRRLVLPVAGLDPRRGLPRFASRPFHRTAAAKRSRVPMHRDVRADVAGTTDIPSGRKPARVVLWADSFTDGLDPQIPEAMIAVLEDAGFEVFVSAGDACCGVTWISTGQLDGARKRLEHLLKVLGPWAVNGVPIIGVEPSCTAVLRSDLVELLPDDPRAHAVAQHTFTLAEVLTGRAPVRPRQGWEPPSLAGVTAVVQPHCHHYSVMGYRADRELLERAGATVTEAAGCCGLAGNWGYEKGHYDVSVQVAHNSLIPALEKAGLVGDGAPDDVVYLADGVSCRTQAEQLVDVEGLHLAEALAARLAR